MSITIISPQSAAPQAAVAQDSALAAPAANDSSGAALDFASLLLGQLTPRAENAPALGSSTADSREDGDAVGTESAGAQDNTAAVLVALGIVPIETRPTGDSPSAKAGNASDALAPLNGGLGATPGDRLKTLESSEAQASSGGVAATGAETLTALTDKAAKFAVPVAPPREAETSNTTQTAESAASLQSAAPAGGIAHAAHTPPPPRAENRVELATPLSSPDWNNDFSQKVVWLANNDKQSAQITINPPQMGPIEVSINMDKGSATATFVSANAEVRESIETALPRLREMLAGAGIELGQANVSAESFRQQANKDEWRSATPRWANDNAILGTQATGSLPAQAFLRRQGNGMVDIFA